MNAAYESIPLASPPSAAQAHRTLKGAVLSQLVDAFRWHMPEALIRRALEEADEVASATGFPHLFLPLLAEEKVRAVHAAISDVAPLSRRMELTYAA